MILVKKLRSILIGKESGLWLSFILIAAGALFSFYYGSKLETTTHYTINDQSTILRTLNDIEKMDILIKHHFYLKKKSIQKKNLQKIKNLRTEIDLLMNNLASKHYFPRFKLLNKKWKDKIDPLIDLLIVVDGESVDLKNLESFLQNFRNLSDEILMNNREVKSIEIEKLKYLRVFTIFIIVIAFLILLKKLMTFRGELDQVNNYSEDILNNKATKVIPLKDKKIHELKRNIDIQRENYQILHEQKIDFIDLIQEVFIICKPDFTITYCSKEIKKLLGRESFELENKKLEQIFESIDFFEEIEMKYYKNGKKLFNIPLKCTNEDGQLFDVNGTLVNYYDKIQKKDVILIVLKDGSAARQIEYLTEKSKQLFHNSKMASLGEMSGSIAHEINNPLMIIKGSVRRLDKLILREGHFHDEVDKLLDRLNRMSDRISSIMYVMQSFGDRHGITEKEYIYVKDLIISTVELCSEKLKARGIDIDYSWAQSDIQARVSQADISQALLSIIDNACDGIELNGIKEGLISFKVFYEEKRLFILVRNNGAPIENSNFKKIFDPFFSNKEKGIGMGLSIAHTLCQRNEVDLRLDCLFPVTFRLEFLGAVKVPS